jgi:biopolymer transport protein ExbD
MGGAVEINMSPMIDCVFLLLIFFVVTTVFVKETGVEIEKPRAVSARSLEQHSVMIALTANNAIVYAGQHVELNSVRGIVARELRSGKLPVIIMADRGSSTGSLVALMDECRRAGAEDVSVAASSAK